MINCFRLFLLACLGAASISVPRAAAQDSSPHPSEQVVQEYLSMILTRQWKKSADIVDEASMKTLQVDYVQRIKQARTMDEEEAMIRRIGKSTIKEVEAMPPREWYAAYNDGLKEHYKLEDEKLALIRNSISLKTLSIAPDEDGKLVHVLVKATYTTGDAKVERIELTTLRNNGGKWQVVLDGQAPKITPLKPGSTPDPLGTPTKPAPRPAPKPAPKPKTR